MRDFERLADVGASLVALWAVAQIVKVGFRAAAYAALLVLTILALGTVLAEIRVLFF